MRQSDFPLRLRLLVPALLSFILAACATETLPPTEQRDTSSAREGGLSDYLEDAQDAEDDADLLLDAAEAALADGNTDIAGELAARLTRQIRDSQWQDASPDHLRYLLLQAALQQAEGQYRDALRTLNTFPAPRWQASSEALYQRWLEQRIATLLDTGQRLAAVHDHIELGELLPADLQQANRNRIWDILGSTPDGTTSRARSVDSYEMRGWLELLDMIRSRPDNIEDQISIIEQWRNRWNRHSAADALPDALAHLLDVWESRPTRLALLLPVQQAAGDAVIQGFMSAYYHALAREQDVPTVRIYDTSSPGTTQALYRQAVEDGAELVIGPLDKEAVRDLQNRRTMPVPTLALNYTDNGQINPDGLYQFGLAPEDDIRQLTRAARLEGHRLAASLTPGGEEYRRIRELFGQQWRELDGQVLAERSFPDGGGYPDLLRDMLAVDQSEARFDRLAAMLPREDIAFIPRRRQDIDMLFLLASPAQGRQVAPTLDFFYAGDVPVFAMPSIHDGSTEASRNRDLDGIRFPELPWLLDQESELKDQVNETWPTSSGAVQRLRALGVDSFRLYTRLGQLINYPDTRMQGATGTLALTGSGAIQREMPMAQFVNGRARIMRLDLPEDIDLMPR